MPSNSIKAILFDLDGTLLDTLPDLATALNKVLAHQEKKMLRLNEIRSVVSSGIAGLLKLGMGITEKDPSFAFLRNQFIDFYIHTMCDRTQLFPGVETLLSYLKKNKIPWGIVTNKATLLTEKLVKHFTLLRDAKCVIAGDTYIHHKPHPQPLLKACQYIEYPPEHCIYVGDSETDIQAANAAGLFSLIALYGYIDTKEDLNAWNAKGRVQSAVDILDYIH